MIVTLLFAASQFYSHPGRKVDFDMEKVAREISGWTAAEKDAVYTAADLHEYIDGASEIYKRLNVRRVAVRRYVRAGAPQITADLFEMDTPGDAFGAYHHDIRDGAPAQIGRESEFEGASLAFYKDRYVVYITGATADEATRQAIQAIGSAICNAIRGDAPPPALLNLLPPDGLISGGTRYFHDHFLLNLYFYVADDNLLNLDQHTNGVLARYKTAQGQPMTCLVIQYPKKSAADAARLKFLAGYLPDCDPDGAGKTEDGRWTGVRARDKVVCVVFDAPAKADALELIDKIAGSGGNSK